MMLKDCLSMTAGKLKDGKRLYVCPASLETVLAARMMKNEWVNPKFCVNSIWGANRAKFIQGGSR